MKKLITIIFLSTALFAQAQAPDAVYLTDAQLKRLNDTQAAINAAQQIQLLEIYKIRDELAVTSKDYGELERFADGKFGFKKKKAEEKKPEEKKPSTK